MKPNNKDNCELDSVLQQLGTFGRYQIVNFLLLSLIVVLSAIYPLAYIFTAGDLVYRCRVPECEDASSAVYHQEWLPYGIPISNNKTTKYKSCQRYETYNTTHNNGTCDVDGFDREHTLSCTEWVFKTKEVTIVRENWDLQCEDNHWKLNLVGSINNLGQVAGLSVTGFISDRYGRRTMLILACMVSGVMGILRSFSVNYIMFMVFEFLDPVGAAGLFSTPFVLALELVGPKMRVLMGSFISCFYPIGEIILGVCAWWLQDWRTLLRVLYVPSFLVISYYWLVPESVRWLLAKGRIDDAKNTLRRVAKMNKVQLSEESLLSLEQKDKQSEVYEESNSQKQTSPIIQLLKSKKLLLRFINCSYCWVTNTFVFFGLSLNSVVIAGDKYLNFILSAVIELPAYITTYLITDRFGRRSSLSVSLLLSSLACFSFAIIPTDPSLHKVRLAMFLIGKFAITVSFTVIYVYTTELFPTTVRHTVLSSCSMISKIGGSIAPLTPLLTVYLESLPMIVFGGLSLAAGVLAWLFPETLNTHLPDTIEEAENIAQTTKVEPEST